MQVNSTIITNLDLHNISNQIYLGFLNSDPLSSSNQNIQSSYFGGHPQWLYQPNQQSLVCSTCRINLTFLGQIYCPFDAQYTYHRILYILFCDRCLKYFKCIRQQADQKWKKMKTIKKDILKKCCEESYELDNEGFEKKQFIKMINKAKIQLEEQKAIEEVLSEEEEQKEEEQKSQENAKKFKKFKNKKLNQQEENEENNSVEDKNFQNLQDSQQSIIQDFPQNSISNQKFDLLFETYKRIIKQINGPCLLYSDIPLSYNSQPLNPRHFCKNCNSKLSLEVQITQKILLLDQRNSNSKLLLMDWGSLMIYTCSRSCEGGNEEEVVIQYEQESIKQEEIKKLKKKKKNKNKGQKKCLSQGKEIEKESQKLIMNENEENDWD